MTFLKAPHHPDDTLREAIIRTSLQMNSLGINTGKSGNVSARISASSPGQGESTAGVAPDLDVSRPSPSPGQGEGRDGGRMHSPAPTKEVNDHTAFLITPTGIPYEKTRPHQIVAMRMDGTHEGDTLPSSEWRFHRDIYAVRADVHAIVHTHATYATTLACMDRRIPSFHYMVAAAGGNDIRCAPYATFGTQELSDLAVAALQERNACLLSHHGMIACGSNLEKALALAVEVETLARMYWQALQIGEPALLSEAEMTIVLEKFAAYGQQPGRAKG